MLDRIHVPWLPRGGGFKASVLEIGVTTEHLSPVTSLWLAATGEELLPAVLQQLCAADLGRTVGYREAGDQWRWQSESDDGDLHEVDAPSPNDLFTRQGVVEGWLLGVHDNADRFSDAASAIYQGLIGGNVTAIARSPAPPGSPFSPSVELAASFFADFPRLDWTRALLFVPRGLPERHWGYDDFEILRHNIRFGRAGLRLLARKLERQRGKFKSGLSPAVQEQRRHVLAATRFDQRMTDVSPPRQREMLEDINAHLYAAGFRPLFKSQFKTLWQTRASPEMRRSGRPKKEHP